MVAVGTRKGHSENPNVRSDWRMVNWLLGEEKKKKSANCFLSTFLGLMTLLPTLNGNKWKESKWISCKPLPLDPQPPVPVLSAAESSRQQFSLSPVMIFPSAESTCHLLFSLLLKIIKNFVFIAALVTAAKIWKQLRVHQQMNG